MRRRPPPPAPADLRAQLLAKRNLLANRAEDPLAWARALRTMERGGLRLSRAQQRAWRAALSAQRGILLDGGNTDSRPAAPVAARF